MSRRCLNCGFDNRDTAGFCAQCQMAFPVAPLHVPSGLAPLPSTSAAAPLAILIGAHQRFSLTGGSTSVGRNSTCHIILNDTSVSGNHAEVLWDGVQYVLHDLASTNGTWLNGQRITNATPLFSGAQVFFGTVGFTFEIIGTIGAVPASYISGTQAISPQQMQRQITKGVAMATRGTRNSRHRPQVSGKILSEPVERQEPPPSDPARALVMLAIILLFIGMLCSFIATLVTMGILLLLCGGAALLFIVPFLWMPIQMGFNGVMHKIRNEKPVNTTTFQVQDDATSQVFDIGFIRAASQGGGGLHVGDRVEVWGRPRGGNQIQANRIRILESHGVSTSIMVPIYKGWPLIIGVLAIGMVVAVVGLVAVVLGVIKLP